MNEQLRKAIEEATDFVRFNPDYKNEMMRIFDDGKWVLNEEKDASQAKLLRVIELLLQQRDDALDHAATSKSNFTWQQDNLNADLIAALEQGEL